jgi:hypothetical protein
MTALSKATLKNIWRAGFQPKASDFANLIDSWTDYNQSLENLSQSVSAGTTGVAVFEPGSAVTFVAATAAAIAGVPLFSGAQSTARSAAPLGSQMIFAATSAAAQLGLYMQTIGGGAGAFAGTFVNLATYQGSAGVFFGNRFEVLGGRGTRAAPLALPSSQTVYSFLGQATGDASATLTGVGYRVRTVATTSAVANMELQFFVGDDVSGFASADQQFRIRRGAINFQPKSAAPASPAEGDVYYDSVLQKLRCYNGTIWNDLF